MRKQYKMDFCCLPDWRTKVHNSSLRNLKRQRKNSELWLSPSSWGLAAGWKSTSPLEMAVAGRDGDILPTSRCKNAGGSCSGPWSVQPASHDASLWPQRADTGWGGVVITVKFHLLLGNLVLQCCLKCFLNKVLCKWMLVLFCCSVANSCPTLFVTPWSIAC